FVADLSVGDLVRLAPGKDLGECALARAVLAHDGMNLAGVDGEVDALEDFPSAGGGDPGMEVLNFKQWHFRSSFPFGHCKTASSAFARADFTSPKLKIAGCGSGFPSCAYHITNDSIRLLPCLTAFS